MNQNKLYYYTQKQINRMYPKELLDKYSNELGWLYQNGFTTDIDSVEEFEEQLALWDNFENGLDELRNITTTKSSLDIGQHIVVDEFYKICKNSSFCRVEAEDAIYVKSLATINWNNIIKIARELNELFNCQDYEIKQFIETIPNHKILIEKINFLNDKISKDLKVISWFTFTDIINNIYSAYIKYGKTKSDTKSSNLVSNLNSELYGAIGGFNPNTREVKTFIGGAIYEVKEVYGLKNENKIKLLGKEIIKDNKGNLNEPEYFKLVEDFVDGKRVDIEKVKQVIICSMLYGILNLLSLKHNINFLTDNKNCVRAEALRHEFTAILNYCNIPKEYLL